MAKIKNMHYTIEVYRGEPWQRPTCDLEVSYSLAARVAPYLFNPYPWSVTRCHFRFWRKTLIQHMTMTICHQSWKEWQISAKKIPPGQFPPYGDWSQWPSVRKLLYTEILVISSQDGINLPTGWRTAIFEADQPDKRSCKLIQQPLRTSCPCQGWSWWWFNPAPANFFKDFKPTPCQGFF